MSAARSAILALALAGFSPAQTPSDSQALKDAFAEGRAALDAHQYDQAVAALEKAAELGPNQMPVWANLGAAYNGLAATKPAARRSRRLHPRQPHGGNYNCVPQGDAAAIVYSILAANP